MSETRFKSGRIKDVVIRDLTRHTDSRGWLTELFRQDEVEPAYRPVMAYISTTQPGVARGPHEHTDQADFFAFLGPSTFRIHLWDNRKESPTYGTKQVIEAGENAPKSIIIPAGVVHAYRNIGGSEGMVLNFPNRLFTGWGRREPVDEVRHENDPSTAFSLD